ncbi:MAG: hypothetical protein ACKVHE_25550 [Planctomycetales bacterium]
MAQYVREPGAQTSGGECDTVTNAIHRTLRLFHKPGDAGEIRILSIPGRGRPHQAAGYFTDFRKAAELAAHYDRERKPSGIYFVMNEFNPALLARSPNQMTDYPDSTTADANVTRRKTLLVDLDPDRPKGIPSSDEELEASQIVGNDVREWMMGEFGFFEPIEAMSGNGWHLLFPIDMPNDEESTRIVKDILEAAAARFGGQHTPSGVPPVTVDTSVFNAARITKLYGTVARKGHGIPGRPIRRSKIVYVPDYLEPAEDGGHRNES